MASSQSAFQSNGDGHNQGDVNKRKADDGDASDRSKYQKTEEGQRTLDEVLSNGKNDHTQTDGQEDDNKLENAIPSDERNLSSRDGLNQTQEDSKTATNVDADVESTNKNEGVPAVNGTNKGKPRVGAIEQDAGREEAQPSNLLEKGIIYFFTRGRVGIEDIESVTDLQRSYIVLRPIPDGAKITEGPMDDLKNNRLIALPKKVWPKSGKDRFMAFVEQAKVSNQDLKESFFQGSEYQTKTVGTRQTPPVTPVGEGVYGITSTGNQGETHLVYMLTVPQDPGEMQRDMGIESRGSFILSLKNPEVKGPANASLPEKPDFPTEFLKEFRNRGWMPAEPKHLDYPNAQMLLIGEKFDSGHGLDATKKDEKSSQKETPQEELEKLEHEDDIRIKHLKGDETIFDDLGIDKKEYPDVATTW